MSSICDNPLCTTISVMLSEGSVRFDREEGEANVLVRTTWTMDDDGKRYYGYGANVRDAIEDCVMARMGE